MSAFKNMITEQNQMLTEALNTAPYELEMTKKGSEILFLFKDDEFQVRFRNAPKMGTNVRRVTIRQKQGSTYKDALKGLGSDTAKILSTVIAAAEEYAKTPIGKSTDGLILDFSKKAIGRGAKILQMVLKRNKKLQRYFSPVDTKVVSDAGMVTHWLLAKGKKAEDVFNGPETAGMISGSNDDSTSGGYQLENLSDKLDQLRRNGTDGKTYAQYAIQGAQGWSINQQAMDNGSVNLHLQFNGETKQTKKISVEAVGMNGVSITARELMDIAFKEFNKQELAKLKASQGDGGESNGHFHTELVDAGFNTPHKKLLGKEASSYNSVGSNTVRYGKGSDTISFNLSGKKWVVKSGDEELTGTFKDAADAVYKVGLAVDNIMNDGQPDDDEDDALPEVPAGWSFKMNSSGGWSLYQPDGTLRTQWKAGYTPTDFDVKMFIPSDTSSYEPTPQNDDGKPFDFAMPDGVEVKDDGAGYNLYVNGELVMGWDKGFKPSLQNILDNMPQPEGKYEVQEAIDDLEIRNGTVDGWKDGEYADEYAAIATHKDSGIKVMVFLVDDEININMALDGEDIEDAVADHDDIVNIMDELGWDEGWTVGGEADTNVEDGDDVTMAFSHAIEIAKSVEREHGHIIDRSALTSNSDIEDAEDHDGVDVSITELCAEKLGEDEDDMSAFIEVYPNGDFTIIIDSTNHDYEESFSAGQDAGKVLEEYFDSDGFDDDDDDEWMDVMQERIEKLQSAISSRELNAGMPRADFTVSDYNGTNLASVQINNQNVSVTNIETGEEEFWTLDGDEISQQMADNIAEHIKAMESSEEVADADYVTSLLHDGDNAERMTKALLGSKPLSEMSSIGTVVSFMFGGLRYRVSYDVGEYGTRITLYFGDDILARSLTPHETIIERSIGAVQLMFNRNSTVKFSNAIQDHWQSKNISGLDGIDPKTLAGIYTLLFDRQKTIGNIRLDQSTLVNWGEFQYVVMLGYDENNQGEMVLTVHEQASGDEVARHSVSSASIEDTTDMIAALQKWVSGIGNDVRVAINTDSLSRALKMRSLVEQYVLASKSIKESSIDADANMLGNYRINVTTKKGRPIGINASYYSFANPDALGVNIGTIEFSLGDKKGRGYNNKTISATITRLVNAYEKEMGSPSFGDYLSGSGDNGVEKSSDDSNNDSIVTAHNGDSHMKSQFDKVSPITKTGFSVKYSDIQGLDVYTEIGKFERVIKSKADIPHFVDETVLNIRNEGNPLPSDWFNIASSVKGVKAVDGALVFKSSGVQFEKHVNMIINKLGVTTQTLFDAVNMSWSANEMAILKAK